MLDRYSAKQLHLRARRMRVMQLARQDVAVPIAKGVSAVLLHILANVFSKWSFLLWIVMTYRNKEKLKLLISLQHIEERAEDGDCSK